MPQAPVAPVARVAPVAPVTYCCRLSKVSHTCVASNAGTTRKRNATKSNTRKLPSCKFQTCDFCYFDSESIIIIISGCSVVARWLLGGCLFWETHHPERPCLRLPLPGRSFAVAKERRRHRNIHTIATYTHQVSVSHTQHMRSDAGKTQERRPPHVACQAPT
jgi:hypothetical protein